MPSYKKQLIMSLFNDTKVAFADKTTEQLEKAKWMFTMIKFPQLTSIGINLLNFSIKNNFPFVEGLSKKHYSNSFVVALLESKARK